ncbi:hypothetical protein MBLNU459_g0273t1 [Dothideomycetes sp. NU459]
MLPGKSVTITSSNSTGSERIHITDNESTSSSLQSSASVGSSRSQSSSADSYEDDDIGPSDSASRPRYASRERVESRPKSSRRASSSRVPTTTTTTTTIHPSEREERDRSAHRPRRVHSSRRDHRSHREREQEVREHEEFHHRVRHVSRLPSDGSTDSVASSHSSGGYVHYPDAQEMPYRPHSSAQWYPAHPQDYPPSMASAHHDPRALMSLPHQDPFAAYAQPPGAFSPPPGAPNPFAPMASSGGYFGGDPLAAAPHQPPPHSRPPPAPRPQSYAAPSPMGFPDGALAPYYPQYTPGMYPGMPPLHPQYAHLYYAQHHTPSPPPPAEPAAPVEKVDEAARILAMLAEIEEKKAAVARQEAAEKEKLNTESAKIAAMLQKFEDERLLREKEAIAKAEAEAAKKAAAQARDAEISEATKKAKEAAEKEAAEAAKKATEEHEKKLAEIQKAAEEHEKKKKELEEELAKTKPDPDSTKAPIKFKDAVNRDFAVPWTFAKTWKGMENLIKQAFLHVETVGPHVLEGHYDLIGPDNEIILPQVWEVVVQPGWEILMELWPIPEPEPKHMPGTFPVEPPRRGGRKKDTKAPRRAIVASRHVEPSPAVVHAGNMMPPPLPSHHRMPAAPMAPEAGDPDEIIAVIDEGAAAGKPKKSGSVKKKDVKIGLLTGWMLGGGGPRRARRSS